MFTDETLLIDRAQAGDRSALDELVTRHWHPIYRLACYKTGQIEDAQELTQETFFRAFRSLPAYRKTNAAFKSYLSQIANNLIIDFWRKKNRTPVLADLGTVEITSPDAGPDESLLIDERRKQIAAILQELPPEQRQAVQLRIITGLSVRDTAAALGKSEAAVKMLQQRALKTLRTVLLERNVLDNHFPQGGSL